MKFISAIGFLAFLSSLAFSACNNEKKINSHQQITPADWIRFEELIESLDTANLSAETMQIQRSYPAFSRLYFDQILMLPRDTQARINALLELKKDSSYLVLYNDVKTTFSDFQPIQAELDQALSNYASMLSGSKTLPDVYTFISGFQYQSLVFENHKGEALGLGLDLFLGEDFPYALIDPGNPAFSAYLTRAFNKDHLVKKALEVLIEDKMAPPAKSDFLSLMIWGGKKLYALDKILDFKADTVIFEYTPDQLEWCKNNEVHMWNFFFEKDLFYETDVRSFNKLVAPSPYSPGMPREAPGATGNYMGYRIVQAYMAQHPKIDLSALLRMDDAQVVLDRSRFKPGR